MCIYIYIYICIYIFIYLCMTDGTSGISSIAKL